MSFRLRNAAEAFQRFMDEILKDLDFCFAYIDDIIVFSRYPQEHDQHHILFILLQNYGILLNPSKCVFRAPKYPSSDTECRPCVSNPYRNVLQTFMPVLLPRPSANSGVSWGC